MKKVTNIFILFVFLVLTISCKCPDKTVAKEKLSVPQLDGEWWQLTTTYPDISPYEWSPGDNKVCDFTMYKDVNQTWHIVSCIRGNNYPGSNRFLYEWTANNLTDTLWKEEGVFMATGVSADKEDGFGFKWDSTLYPRQGLLQAPHCILEDNKYYLFYNNASAMCKISDDGISWTDTKNDKGSHHFFEMGRDVMIFDDRASSGNWIAYYTTGGEYPQFMGARSCPTLTGEWSEVKLVHDGYSNTRYPIYPNEMAESPFVIKYEDMYYLFVQMHVFASKDPMDFTEYNKVANLETGHYHERVWAPEIIEDNGQYYLAAYRPSGLWMIKLKFVPGS